MCTEVLTQAVSVTRDANRVSALIDELSCTLVKCASVLKDSHVMWVCSFMSQIVDSPQIDHETLFSVLAGVLGGRWPRLSTAAAAQTISESSWAEHYNGCERVTQVLGVS